MAEKKIWVIVKRFDLDVAPGGEVTCVSLDINCDSDSVRKTLRDSLSIPDTQLILKLRNPQGSLIPINSRIKENNSAKPYILEVVKVYQNIQPQERSVKLNTYSETIRTRLTEITNRIEALEKAAPELNTRRAEKIKAEMDELDQKIEFLKKRLQEADNSQWRGMFKKNPLW